MPPINPYYQPQLTIRQELEKTSSSAVPRMAACILASKYLLSRYSKETTVAYPHATGGQTIPWEYVDDSGATVALPATYVADAAGAALWAEDLRVELAAYVTGDAKIYLDSLTTPNILRIDTTKFAGAGLDTLFRGRDVQIGDTVRVDDATTVRERRVIGLIGELLASTYGSNAASNDSEFANGAFNPLTDAVADTAVELAKPAGATVTIVQTAVNFNIRGSSVIGRKVAEEYTVTVTEGGVAGAAGGSATFAISSLSGIYAATGVKSTDGGGGALLISDAELAGATFQIDTPTTVVAGQVFRFRVYQAYTQFTPGTEIAASDSGSGYTGTKDTTYIVEVTLGTVGDTAAGAEVKIYDTQNTELVQEDVVVAEDTIIAVGTKGLEVTFNIDVAGITQLGMRAGDIYYINAVAAKESTTVFDRILLNGPVIDPATFILISTALGATFNLYKTGKIAKTDASIGDAYTADVTDGIAVIAALALYVPERSLAFQWVSYEDAVGELHSSFRAIVPTNSSEGLKSVSSDAANAAANGAIALENDLAFGVSECLRGAVGQAVYYINTGGNSKAHYATALKKLEATDVIYALAPITEDPEVRAVVEQHVLAMSAPDKKNFRRAYYGIDSPGEYVILNLQADSSPYNATITDYGGVNLLVTLTTPADGVDFDSVTLVTGDKIKLTSNGAEYEISEQLSPGELLLVAGPASPISPAVPFTLWKADTADSQGSYVTSAANALDDRRSTLVWYEDGTRTLDGSPVIIPAKFAAAEIAGIRSALPPQVGLTKTEVNAITNAPAMYNKYGIDDLNTIAGEGVLIVSQVAENGAVFIRHQLTTEADNGLLYYEDNITMIVDYLSFRFKDKFDSVIGNVNVTDRTIDDLFNESQTLLDAERRADIDSLYGAVIKDYNGLTVAVDPNLRDRINIVVNISVPIPLNTLDITLKTFIDLPDV